MPLLGGWGGSLKYTHAYASPLVNRRQMTLRQLVATESSKGTESFTASSKKTLQPPAAPQEQPLYCSLRPLEFQI